MMIRLFHSDNGAALARPKDLGGVNLPLRSGKGSCFEGGVRVPYIMSWSGTIAAGRTSDLLVSSIRGDGSLKPSARVLRETFSRWSKP
jgi:arylsulfatase A-like enzyme